MIMVHCQGIVDTLPDFVCTPHSLLWQNQAWPSQSQSVCFVLINLMLGQAAA